MKPIALLAFLLFSSAVLLLADDAAQPPAPGIVKASHEFNPSHAVPPADFMETQGKKKDKKAKKEYKGEATYYNDAYHGKNTASGDVYDKNKMTAAVRHDALPLEFGTMVEVTSVTTGKKVKVKVNDRMGGSASAFIDLSRAAAEKIGLVDAGRMEVTVRVVK